MSSGKLKLQKKKEEEDFLRHEESLRNHGKFVIVKKEKKRTLSDVALEFDFISDYIKGFPASQKTKSHNRELQRRDFFKRYIFKYDVPKVIYNTAIMQGTDYEKNNNLSPNSQKWLEDIISGKSFYKENKEVFTKKEAGFLLSDYEVGNSKTLKEAIYRARCKARGFNKKLENIVTRVFSRQFSSTYIWNEVIIGFLDFIERNKDYNWEDAELSDICDFVRTKFYVGAVDEEHTFSFSGRTVASLINLSNEWHNQLHRQQNENNGSQKTTWAGISVNDATYDENGYTWTITQIRDSKTLEKEGKKMHHCVGSYIRACTSGRSAIFNISRMDKYCGVESLATFEVVGKEVSQIRGPCNSQVSGETLKHFHRFCNKNYIKYSLAFGDIR
jgi:hypothetical protein